ncbi:CBS domain-containing protein [Streptomyces sp. HNM0663]|uniref:CBS domain-containing protein n=1 Tax=Streptomyces chengmaiensis TaxID=3040919 RepID=A0ABT6HGL2_9ACTN|nr:CBS domain-containing protein [Streptomyces chengmaiensis]MDH2387900.1 CBS domain-containing protein [Streptomyces chengmaiensis]
MKHRKVGSLMTDEVVSAVTSTPFKDVAKQLAEHDISGLPVLDEQDRVLGVVSESDLLLRQASAEDAGPERRTPWHAAAAAAWPDDGEQEALTAGRLMSAPAVTVHADDTVAQAARTMVRRGVERLPVVDDEDRLVGIVTRRDLLRVFLRPDPEIRLRVLEEVVTGVLGLPPDSVGIRVVDGTVTLEGEVERQSQIPLLVKLTAQLEGVVSVVDRLTARIDDSLLTPPAGRRTSWPGEEVVAR